MKAEGSLPREAARSGIRSLPLPSAERESHTAAPNRLIPIQQQRSLGACASAIASTYAAPLAKRVSAVVSFSGSSLFTARPSAKFSRKETASSYSAAARICGSRNSRTGWASATGPLNSNRSVPPSLVSYPPVISTCFSAPFTVPTAPSRRNASPASNMRMVNLPIFSILLARTASHNCVKASFNTPSLRKFRCLSDSGDGGLPLFPGSGGVFPAPPVREFPP